MKKMVQFDHPTGKKPVVLKCGQVAARGGQSAKKMLAGVKGQVIEGQSIHKSESNSVPEWKNVRNNKDASGKWAATSVGIGDIRQDVIHAENGVFILDDSCVIQHCNGKGSELFGFKPKSLISHHVAKVLPHLADLPLICNEQINPRLRFLSRAGHYFEAVGNDGVHFKCGLIFNLKKYQDKDYVQLIICPISADTKRMQ
ncbi:PAS domain-containing protein [Methylicorpusculum oleiharenae]|uniref:PAS domain-containing protein n=1 Tax=Methylicorpusculum oleiharenae TaxID=1338687 RepID=UPI001357C6A8|nr:PAS domain-containing protein [Methylicorpusculum oleiharenae]MCD2452485.1 PAS domain-containing protein [Methylicorpusculum oleiharenae]